MSGQGERVVRTSASAAGAADDSALVAQFPGKVRKILVAVGAQVNAGDKLILVEAMKMEFAVVAPFSGTVSTIKVTEGQSFSPGARFADVTVAATAAKGGKNGG